MVDVDEYDVIVGYRADDSYFSFAQDFIMGTISLQKLAQAMRLGKLGEQIVLKSEKAFSCIKYIGNELALAQEYYIKKQQRDLAARREYARSRTLNGLEDIYILDILRGRVNEQDLQLR